jgi:hypothetical protein
MPLLHVQAQNAETLSAINSQSSLQGGPPDGTPQFYTPVGAAAGLSTDSSWQSSAAGDSAMTTPQVNLRAHPLMQLSNSSTPGAVDSAGGASRQEQGASSSNSSRRQQQQQQQQQRAGGNAGLNLERVGQLLQPASTPTPAQAQALAQQLHLSPSAITPGMYANLLAGPNMGTPPSAGPAQPGSSSGGSSSSRGSLHDIRAKLQNLKAQLQAKLVNAPLDKQIKISQQVQQLEANLAAVETQRVSGGGKGCGCMALGQQAMLGVDPQYHVHNTCTCIPHQHWQQCRHRAATAAPLLTHCCGVAQQCVHGQV